jgi:hypothetical protein
MCVCCSQKINEGRSLVYFEIVKKRRKGRERGERERERGERERETKKGICR